MNVDVRYAGRSGVVDTGGGNVVSFAPNLARTKVFFDAELRFPLRYREAMSALHEVVVGDLRRTPKDRTLWRAFRQREASKEAELRGALMDRARVEAAEALSREAPPKNLDEDFRRAHSRYWNARVVWANELAATDPAMFRALVPCDPIVTVADDAVLFECFSKDESAYGCLLVSRDGFGPHDTSGSGTTNVDYSLGLYEHFQTLRTYKPSRLRVDPSGFDVQTSTSHIREEKIDVPATWLRGFGQLQVVPALPHTSVELTSEVVYSILAFLARNRERVGPRSLRLRLLPGMRPVVILDPFGVEFESHGPPYDGTYAGEVKLWGRRRLSCLKRLLPLADRIEVRVLGSGLPSVWIVHAREMTFVLGLSGWTANDWARGSSLDTLLGDLTPSPAVTERLTRYLQTTRSASSVDLSRQLVASDRELQASLCELARRGQLVFDYATDRYRYRPILPVPMTEAILGPDSPELSAARAIMARGEVSYSRNEPLSGGRTLLVAECGGVRCEGIVDLDGLFRGAKCACSHFVRFGMRNGPCRHLLALRLRVVTPERAHTAPMPPVRTEPSASLVVHLPESLMRTLAGLAEQRRMTLHAIVEQTYRISRGDIGALTQLAVQANPTRSPYRSESTVTQLLSLSQEVAADIQRQAERLNVTVSNIVEHAVCLAGPIMNRNTSLLS